MESLIEPIRVTTSILAVATAFAMWTALNRARALVPWFVGAAAIAVFFTHVTRGVPFPALVPAVASVGVALGVLAMRSPRFVALFTALSDGQWRSLMMLRAVFGSLLLAAGGVGIMPPEFALPAGIGDIVVGALALVVPGSIAVNGNRISRFVVFGVGLVDFTSVVVLLVTVVVPWLVATQSVGISLLLPWVAVPLLAMLNLFGMRLLVGELVSSARAPTLRDARASGAA